jgi:ADP-ribose pyrophosphatase YjhB (NUDIX family)
MKGKEILCPQCGAVVLRYVNPVPTVDIIIEGESETGGKGIVLILRKNDPIAWALPGGFVDYGETLEEAAVREAKEETGLKVETISQLHTYSDPHRDPRQHTISTVFTAKAKGLPRPGDDAVRTGVFAEKNLPFPLAFDHKKILQDYFALKKQETVLPQRAQRAQRHTC